MWSSRRTRPSAICSSARPTPVSEREWVALVQAVASGNEEALRALYGRMHGIVSRFMVSATHERQTAEALTLAVFHHPLGTSLTVVAVSREDVLYAESIRLTPADRF